MAHRGRGHERVVRGAANDPVIRQLQQKFPVRRSAEAKERVAKSRREEIAYHVTLCAMRRGESSEHRIGLEGAVLDHMHGAGQCASRGVVPFVPGCERRDEDAGIGGGYRRMRSSVSRTCSAVSGGNFVSGTATSVLPRFFNRIGVDAISISSRPSPARISSGWPGLSPSASRSGLGTTILPARSMAVFMALRMP